MIMQDMHFRVLTARINSEVRQAKMLGVRFLIFFRKNFEDCLVLSKRAVGLPLWIRDLLRKESGLNVLICKKT